MNIYKPISKLIALSLILNLFCYVNDSFSQCNNWNWAVNADTALVGTSYEGRRMITDASGNVYLAGEYVGDTLTLGSYKLVNKGGDDIFIAKYNISGELIWVKGAGGNKNDHCNGIAIDVSGNLYLTGTYWSDSIMFDSHKLVMNNLYGEMYLVKLDTAGNFIWAKDGNGSVEETGSGVATDSMGNIFVTGTFSSDSLVFGSYTLYNVGNYDVFFVKYDNNGNVLWATSGGGNDMDFGGSIATDASGNLYAMSHYVSSTITFGSNPLSNNGNWDIYFVKMDSDGNIIWAKSFGGTYMDFAGCIAANAAGNVYFTGGFKSATLAFDTITLTNSNSGTGEIFTVKFNPDGEAIWAKSFGGPNAEIGTSCIIDSEWNFYASGRFASPSISFDSYTLSRDGGGDVFISKYNKDGDVLWAKDVGGDSYEESWGMAADLFGNVYMTGEFQSTTISFGTDTLINNSGYNDFYLARISDQINFDYSVTGASQGINDGAIDLTVYSGTQPYDFSWSNGDATKDIVNLAAGTYTVTISDQYSCDTVAAFIVVSDTTDPCSNITITIRGDIINDTDNQNIGSIALTVSGGTTPYTITWSSGDTTQDINSLPAGQYSVLVTDLMGCTATDTFLINSITGIFLNNYTNRAIINIYPNPFTNFTRLYIDRYIKYSSGSLCFLLYDITGRVVKRFNPIPNKLFHIKRDNLPEGFYYYKLSDNKEIIGTGKLIIQ